MAEPPQTRRSALRAAVGTIASSSAVPYGYTISVWSSGAVLMRSHGTPHVGSVFAFIAGAVAGFGLVGMIGHGALSTDEPPHQPRDRVLVGAMHWIAVGAAVGAVALLARVGSWAAWPLGSFAATTLYLLGASLQLAAVAARRNRT